LADNSIPEWPHNKRAELERRVAQVDRDIDEAVYKLYGLTDPERRLVEGE
jgi:hypothetical protein